MAAPALHGQNKADTTDAHQLKEQLEAQAKAMLAEADELLEAAQEAADDGERVENLEWLQEVADTAFGNSGPESAIEVASDLIDEVAQGQLGAEDYMQRARQAIEQGQGGAPLEDGVEPLYALITMGMGKTAIRNLLEEAEKMDMPVIFVLRGYDPDSGGIQNVVEEILAINEYEIEFEAHINPSMFNQAGVERVPAFLHEEESGVVKIRRGAVNLHAALESMSSDELDLVIGETFEIKEPNLLDMIHERIHTLDADQIVRDATQRAKSRLLKAPEELPVAIENESYLVDPAIELTSDIAMPDGTVVAEAGTQVNPLEVAPWREQYVVFDATSQWQVEVAQRWADEASMPTVFISTRLPEDPAERKALGERLDSHVHLLDGLIVERMNLQAIPSRARQDGLHVRIDTEKQNNKEKSA